MKGYYWIIIRWEGTEWTYFTGNGDGWWAVMITVMNILGFVKNGISAQDLSHCQTLKKEVELYVS